MFPTTFCSRQSHGHRDHDLPLARLPAVLGERTKTHPLHTWLVAQLAYSVIQHEGLGRAAIPKSFQWLESYAPLAVASHSLLRIDSLPVCAVPTD
eukprot:2997028-Amphidinium_carterae.2